MQKGVVLGFCRRPQNTVTSSPALKDVLANKPNDCPSNDDVRLSNLGHQSPTEFWNWNCTTVSQRVSPPCHSPSITDALRCERAVSTACAFLETSVNMRGPVSGSPTSHILGNRHGTAVDGGGGVVVPVTGRVARWWKMPLLLPTVAVLCGLVVLGWQRLVGQGSAFQLVEPLDRKHQIGLPVALFGA